MALSALITQVWSTNPTPKQYTLASPSFNRYRMTSTMVDYGDISPAGSITTTSGIVPLGFVQVQYRTNNSWTTATIYTSQTGAQLNTLITA